uniref:Uncharacterized protein n=1 Tax=Cannabis sativa TaxID=3483 RepID=A0A803Q5L0_CANSA
MDLQLQVAVEAQSEYEESSAIFKKSNLNVQAVNVLLDNIQAFERSCRVCSLVLKKMLFESGSQGPTAEGSVSDAISSHSSAQMMQPVPGCHAALRMKMWYPGLGAGIFWMVRQKPKERAKG